MPHQCLTCGHLFAEGSSQLLAGCPDCKGTRFFYTKDAVDAGERQKLADQAQSDLRQVVTDLLQEKAPKTAAAMQSKASEARDGDGWTQLRPRDLRKLIKQVQAEQKELQTNGKATDKAAGEIDWEADAADVDPVAVKASQERVAAAQAKVEELREAPDDQDAKPDTVTVKDAGDYEIDVRALLEKNPLVVQKDGTYLIHLPSLFEAGKD
ncbi:MAG: OapC/ArvC family zinc-ribbon domain-containing protein [Thermoplasmatota archaeon]